MSEFKKIIAALSITEYSKGIFSYAAKLAEALEAELLVVNIINEQDVEAVRSISSMGYEVDGSHYIEGVKEERRQFLGRLIDDAQFPKEKLKLIVRVGNPIDELLNIILEESADMIVMGPKGRTDLEHVIVGSVASKLFRRSPVTIVSYREGEVAEKLRKRILK